MPNCRRINPWSELVGDGTQAIMRVEPAAFFEVELSLCKVNLVVNDQDLRRLKVVRTSKLERDRRWCS